MRAQLKGAWSEGARRPENVKKNKKCSNISVYRLRLVDLSMFTQVNTFLSFFLSSFFFSFLTSNTNSSVRCHVDSLWTTEEQKSLARGVFDTFATHADLLHDVTDTDLRAQSDDTHGRVLATFNRFLTNEIKNWAKKSVVVVVLFVSLFLFCFVVALFVCYFHSHRWDCCCFVCLFVFVLFCCCFVCLLFSFPSLRFAMLLSSPSKYPRLSYQFLFFFPLLIRPVTRLPFGSPLRSSDSAREIMLTRAFTFGVQHVSWLTQVVHLPGPVSGTCLPCSERNVSSLAAPPVADPRGGLSIRQAGAGFGPVTLRPPVCK